MSEDAVISLKSVVKNFGQQRVHDGLELSIPRGKISVILGPSGVGKSVLLKYILGLMRPDEGEVKVNGEDVLKMNAKSLRKMREKLGVLFQGVALFDSMTVFENVALPLVEKTDMKKDEIKNRVIEKLTLMNMEESLSKYPAELSGGMQKRIGLARALQLDPEIVLFDEPTTGLDPETTNNIYRLFSDTQKKLGFTAVIVSHDIPKIFKIADYVAFLHEGKIQAFIPPSEMESCEIEYVQRVLHQDDDWYP